MADNKRTKVEDETVLPAGRYYVGDLCYVIRGEKWDKVYKYMFESNCKHNLTDDCIKTPEGMIFYTLCSGSDREFKDSKGRVYPVDNASISCVHEKWIDKKQMEKYPKPCGYLIDFPEPFTCWIDQKGSFHFGNEVFIDLNVEGDEDYDEDEESEDEEEVVT